MRRIAILIIAFLLPLSAFAGAWGDGSFENDDALDWVTDCSRSASTSIVEAALNTALKSRFLEVSEGSAAIAAAEVVAAARGKPSADLPKDLRAWVERQPKTELVRLSALARSALHRIRDAKVSELKQLWAEGKSNRWESRVVELESRLVD